MNNNNSLNSSNESSSISSSSITSSSNTAANTTLLSNSTITLSSSTSSSRPNSLLPNSKLASSIISPEINTPILKSSTSKEEQLLEPMEPIEEIQQQLNEEDYINFNINLTNKFKEQLDLSKSNRNSAKSESSVVTTLSSASGINNNNNGLNNSSSSNRNSTNSSISSLNDDLLASGNNTPKSNRSSINNDNNNNSNRNMLLSSSFDRNDSSNSLNSKDSSSTTSYSNEQSIMLRVKFPESHQIITKILRLPLNSNTKECLLKIHQTVGLDNYKDCVIIYNQTTLSPNTTLSSIFGGGDDSIVPTIEIKEAKNNKPSPRPILSHSNSVQSLLQGVSIKKRTQSSGQNAKDSILFQPPLPSYTKDLEDLFFITSPNHPNKSIPCLYHKWRSREGKYDSKITILYSSGNMEDIGLTRKNMKILSNILQCNILCYDMTGFGLNAGKPSLKECYEDLNIVFYHLINNLKINSKNIILMGKSIGTISTLKFASTLFPKLLKTKNSQVIIKSPTSPVESCKQYKSVGGIVLLNSFGPGGLSDNIVNLLLSLEAFEHLKKVERITCPVLLIHAEDDQIVNIKSSKKLSKLFNNLFKFTRVKDAGHWNLDTQFLDDYEDDLIEFVKIVSPEQYANRKERDEPLSYAMSPNKVIGSWLDRIELSQYTQNFLQFGYFDMNSISTLDEMLLEMIGIVDQQHILILMKEIDKINKSIYGSTSSNNSTYSMMTISSSCSIDSSLNSNISTFSTISNNNNNNSNNCNNTSGSSISSSSSSSGGGGNNDNKLNQKENIINGSGSTPTISTPSRNSANLDPECTVNSSISSNSCNCLSSDECICNK